VDDLDAAIEFEQSRIGDYDKVVPLKGIDFDVQFADAVDDLEHLLGVAWRKRGWLLHDDVIIICWHQEEGC
jgi:hypothetical protein